MSYDFIITEIPARKFNHEQRQIQVVHVDDAQKHGEPGYNVLDEHDTFTMLVDRINLEKGDPVLFNHPLVWTERAAYVGRHPKSEGALSEDLVTTKKPSLTAQDILLTEQLANKSPEQLNNAQIRQDIERLEYALKHMYAGYYTLHPQVVDVLKHLDQLKEIETITPNELQLLVGDLLKRVPDNHLSIKFFEENSEQTPNPYDYDIKTFSGSDGFTPYSVPIITIKEMLSTDDPRYETFFANIRNVVDSSAAIIIDLRSNGGGDDPPEALLAALSSKTLEAGRVWRLQDPTALAGRVNVELIDKQENPADFNSAGEGRIRSNQDRLDEAEETSLNLWKDEPITLEGGRSTPYSIVAGQNWTIF